MPLDPPLAVMPVHTPATPAAPLAVRPVHSAATPAAPLASRPVAPLVAPVAAALTSGNIRWTAAIAGPEGNDITIAVAAPASGQVLDELLEHATSFAVSGKNLTVTPCGMDRLLVTGTLTGDGSTPITFPVLLRVPGEYYYWSDTGIRSGDNAYACYRDEDEGYWLLRAGDYAHVPAAGCWISNHVTFDPSTIPTSGNSTWLRADYAEGYCTGLPAVAVAASSKAQVIAAAAASVTASALVTAAASGDVTAAVATLTATHLTGGSGPAAPLPVQP